MWKALRGLCGAVLAAGIVLTAAGLYLLVVKAGIPYQDPTPEMTERWVSAYQAGERALACGAALLIAGGVGRILCRRG